MPLSPLLPPASCPSPFTWSPTSSLVSPPLYLPQSTQSDMTVQIQVLKTKPFSNPPLILGLSRNTFSKILHTQDTAYFLLVSPTLFLPFWSADSQAFFPLLKLKYATSYLSASGEASPSAKLAHPCPHAINFPSLPNIHLTIPTYPLEFI